MFLIDVDTARFRAVRSVTTGTRMMETGAYIHIHVYIYVYIDIYIRLFSICDISAAGMQSAKSSFFKRMG